MTIYIYFDNDLIDYLNLDKNKKYTVDYITQCTINKCKCNINQSNLYIIDNSLKHIINNVEVSVTYGILPEFMLYLGNMWNNGITNFQLKKIISKKIVLNMPINYSILDNFCLGRSITTLVI